MVGVLTSEQAREYWITLRRDRYWLDLGVPFDEAVRRACGEWAASQTHEIFGKNQEA